jgi:formylglycine-generating enzyme required for sulfatase activity
MGEAGAFALLCGCDEGQQAREVPDLKQGLFSRALLEEFEAAVQGQTELKLDDRWETELRGRMSRLAARFGLPGNQRPWIKRSGQIPVLLGGRPIAAETVPLERLASPGLGYQGRVLCPACGLRNDPDETFRCRVCGRDYLCQDHFVKADRCCEECAEKLQREHDEAEQKAKAEQDQKAKAEKERQAREAVERQRAQADRIEQEAEQRRRNPDYATKDQPWENSLGMKFVPVPGTKVLFCIWETRVEDYGAFARATKRSWYNPNFQQDLTHPAVNVSWDDAKAFCPWLTEKEQAEGLLAQHQTYRLPTDEEWSWAVGIGDQEFRSTPRENDGKLVGVYPWGKQWPPPKGAGNYSPSLKVDDYEHTSPVGSFAANKFGLYDLGGNVWEWCEDFYDGKSGARVLRGGRGTAAVLITSCRPTASSSPGLRYGDVGFRVVLAGGSAP